MTFSPIRARWLALSSIAAIAVLSGGWLLRAKPAAGVGVEPPWSLSLLPPCVAAPAGRCRPNPAAEERGLVVAPTTASATPWAGPG